MTTQQLCRLRDLAQNVSRYLRQHAASSVRVAAALLLAASMAACSASATDTEMVDAPAVAPLTQEVVSGLPRGPGTYPVVPGSVFRDQRGVYQLEWLNPDTSVTDVGTVAHLSRLRLIQDGKQELEIPATGDPILHMPENEKVGLIEQAQVGSARPGAEYRPSPFNFWAPFLVGAMLMNRPAYYEPPRTVYVPQPTPGTSGSGRVGGSGIGGGSGSSSTGPLTVNGGAVSDTAPPLANRVTGVTSAVSGRAGGTGSGSAVTNRNLGSGASSGTGSTSNGSSSVGSGSSSSSSSTSGGSVSSPRSGGFSSGSGSSSGSSSS